MFLALIEIDDVPLLWDDDDDGYHMAYFCDAGGPCFGNKSLPPLSSGSFSFTRPPPPPPRSAVNRCRGQTSSRLSRSTAPSLLACNADDVTLRHCSTFRPPRPVPLGKSRATDELGLGWQSPPSRRVSTAAASSSSKLQGVPQGSALISRPPGTSTFVIVDRGSLPSSIGRE